MTTAPILSELAEVIDYDAVYDEYLKSLIDTLRGFSAKVPGLELWVPDENPLVSLENLLDSASSLGRSSIKLQLGPDTVAKLPEREIVALGQSFGTVRLERRGNQLLLEVTGMGASRVRSRGPQAAKARANAVTSAATSVAAQASLPKPVVDIYLPALERAAAAPFLAAKASATAQTVAASFGSATLTLAIAGDHQVESASFQAEAAEHALLGELCRVITGLPLLEACYHGAIRLEYRLRPEPNARAVPGIVLPRAAHPRFALVENLLQAVLTQYRTLTGFEATLCDYDDRPQKAWLEATDGKRRALLEAALAATLPALGLTPDDVSVALIRYDVRIELAFSEAWRKLDQPRLVVALEQALRELVDPRLEVYVEELRDKNKLRRLAVVETPR